MKKMAFFVEGQTEQIFVNRLLQEIAGQKKVVVELKKFSGTNRPQIQIIPRHAPPSLVSPTHGVLIYDCCGDEGVKKRILDESISLLDKGYLDVIGIRDLYPLKLSDLSKLESNLNNGTTKGTVRIPGLPPKTSIIIAVSEIEAWFLAESNHFSYIDEKLNKAYVESQTSALGFNPYVDDATLRLQPSQDLHNIYQLAGKSYTKKKNNIERTIDCLDYADIYLRLAPIIAKLSELIAKIDGFLELA